MWEQHGFCVIQDAYEPGCLTVLQDGTDQRWASATAAGQIESLDGDTRYITPKSQPTTEEGVDIVLANTANAINTAGLSSMVVRTHDRDLIKGSMPYKTTPGSELKVPATAYGGALLGIVQIEGETQATIQRSRALLPGTTTVAQGVELSENDLLLIPNRWQPFNRKRPVYPQINHVTSEDSARNDTGTFLTFTF